MNSEPSNEADRELRVRLLLAAQRALLGHVSSGLYGACVAQRDNSIVISFYIASSATDDEREDLRVASSEVIADFNVPFEIDEQFIEVPDRTTPLATVGDWVFLRSGFDVVQG